MAKPFNKMFGQPTTKSTNLLEQQLTQAAGAVATKQWGGTSGCLALVLKQEPLKDTAGLNGKVDRQTKPALVHKDINKDSTPYKIMVEQEEQKKKIWDWETQKSVDHLLVDRIVGSVDPQYLEARSKDYLGFTKETTKPLIEYIRTDWCRVSTHHKMKTRKHSQGAM